MFCHLPTSESMCSRRAFCGTILRQYLPLFVPVSGAYYATVVPTHNHMLPGCRPDSLPFPGHARSVPHRLLPPACVFSSPGANVKLQNLSRDGPLGQHNGKHGVIREVLSSGKIKVPHPLAIRLDPSIAAHSRDSTRATACPSFLPALAAVVLLG